MGNSANRGEMGVTGRPIKPRGRIWLGGREQERGSGRAEEFARVMEGHWLVARVYSAMGKVERASGGKRFGVGGRGGDG